MSRVPAASAADAGPRWPSVAVLVAANLVPLYGVLALGWDTFVLVLLFWIENVVIDVLNAARMLCVDPRNVTSRDAKVLMVPLFRFHYGMFTAIHGVLVFALFGGKGFGVDALSVLEPVALAVHEPGLEIPLAALAGSHLLSFFWNHLGKGEYRRASLSMLMAQPYARVVVLHLVILGGGFAVMTLRSPVCALVLLVALKVGFDLWAHLREHQGGSA